jgi:hypothetical protein
MIARYFIAIAAVVGFAGGWSSAKLGHHFALHGGTPSQQDAAGEVAHARTEFHFTVDLPYATAAPLFGPLAEKKWAPDWAPRFLYPTPPVDQEGAVFRVDPGPSHSSVWINTAFDLAGGHVQYVYLLNQAMITRIDIKLAANGAEKTDVNVVYDRTALDPTANDHVQHFASLDTRKAAGEWQEQFHAYAEKLKAEALKR